MGDNDAIVVVVPSDLRGWVTGGMNSRLSATVRTSPTGSYTVAGLPSGDYRIVALSEDVAIEARDPAFMKQLAQLGDDLVATGGQRTQDLRTETRPLARHWRHRVRRIRPPQISAQRRRACWRPACSDFPSPHPTATPEASRTARLRPAQARSAELLSTEEAIRKPLRRATVQLSGVGLIPSRVATTDDEGRFVFRDLPEGRFSLSASKPPFVDAAYGATRQGRSGAPIALTAGQHVTGVSIRMIRGAVIEGTVRDGFGLPEEQAQVSIFQRRPGANGPLQLVLTSATPLPSDRRPRPAGSTGCLPGDYIIGA
ncbi:MAG: carboxypeptidase regulatory-like domain-containing protein [Acidobacteria bacterium]|nr:carboxypeptidase regulatory-like domain-containing protein [Acidobacteriota bacterium]